MVVFCCHMQACAAVLIEEEGQLPPFQVVAVSVFSCFVKVYMRGRQESLPPFRHRVPAVHSRGWGRAGAAMCSCFCLPEVGRHGK